jgi:hypothetical protein
MRPPRGRNATLTAICAFAAIAALNGLFPASATALLELRFATPPALPTLPTVTLNGKAQSDTTAMTPFAVEDTRLTKSGWNLTAQGQSGTGKSAVFAAYCPKAKCGTAVEGYVAGGPTLAAGSLVLNSTGASFTGGLGTAPALQCPSGCAVDSATPVKVASQGTGLLSGEGLWSASGFSASSLALAAPTTMRAPPNEQIYRVNVLWTLSTGP